MQTTHTAEQIAEMAAAAKTQKSVVTLAIAKHQAGAITYETLIGEAREYCRLFTLWARAKYPTGRNEYGKRIPSPDPRALIR